jgi:hypothetical protein
MASATNLSQVNLARRLYGPEMIDQMWKDDPYLNRVTKRTSGFGEGRYVVVRIGSTAGVGGSFGGALRNQGPTSEVRFFVTERSIYSVFSMKGSFLRKHRGKENTLLEGYKSQANSALEDFQKLVEHASWNDIGGTLGQVATTINTSNTGMIVPFRNAKALYGLNLMGKHLTFSTDAGNGTSPAGELNDGTSNYSVTVVKEDPDNNQLVVTGDNGATTLATAVVGITNASYVFIDDFYGKSLSGKRAWNPISAPSASESFFGLDRSTSPHKLSGWRTGSKGSMFATLTFALMQGDLASLEMPMCFSMGEDWWNFSQELDNKTTMSSTEEKAGKKMIEIASPAGSCKLVRSNRVPAGYAWVGDPAMDVLLSEGEFPQILNEDKVGTMLRAGDDDAYQSRLGGDANFLPDDKTKKLGPGAWTVVTW